MGLYTPFCSFHTKGLPRRNWWRGSTWGPTVASIAIVDAAYGPVCWLHVDLNAKLSNCASFQPDSSANMPFTAAVVGFASTTAFPSMVACTFVPENASSTGTQKIPPASAAPAAAEDASSPEPSNFTVPCAAPSPTFSTTCHSVPFTSMQTADVEPIPALLTRPHNPAQGSPSGVASGRGGGEGGGAGLGGDTT